MKYSPPTSHLEAESLKVLMKMPYGKLILILAPQYLAIVARCVTATAAALAAGKYISG